MSDVEQPSRLAAEAQALIDLGRYEQALASLGRAAALDPEAFVPRVLRAQALLALERSDEAQEAAIAAIALDPESDHAQRLLALAQLRAGADKAAKKTALRAVGLDPENSFNYLVLAEALQATRDEAGAMAAARHAIELAPRDSAGHELMGRLLIDHEDMTGAEAALRRALAIDPENEATLNNLALVLEQRGRREQAAAGLESAARIDPGDEVVRANVLRLGRRRLSFLRGLFIALAALGLVAVAISLATADAGGLITGVVMIVLGAVVADLTFRYAYSRQSGPTAQLLRDDYLARRFRPWRWHWHWLTRLRPWWWLLLQRVPPPGALAINVAVAVAFPLLALGIPFSVWRTWRWYRRKHPAPPIVAAADRGSRRSWQPPPTASTASRPLPVRSQPVHAPPPTSPDHFAALRDLALQGADMSAQRSVLAAGLRAHGMSDDAIAAVLEHLRPGIVLLELDDGTRRSRIGGPPQLPPGAEWPRDPDGVPLTFIASLDLEELPALAPLPAAGTLLIFWSERFFEFERMDLRAATRVFWLPRETAPAEPSTPEGTTGYEPIPLTGVLMPMLGGLEQISVAAKDGDLLYETCDDLERVYRHQLLGVARDIQGPVLEEIPYWLDQGFPESRQDFSDAELRGEGWLLLAQIESTGRLVFGDAGALYLVIPRDDLESRRFDRVLGIMQCI